MSMKSINKSFDRMLESINTKRPKNKQSINESKIINESDYTKSEYKKAATKVMKIMNHLYLVDELLVKLINDEELGPIIDNEFDINIEEERKYLDPIMNDLSELGYNLEVAGDFYAKDECLDKDALDLQLESVQIEEGIWGNRSDYDGWEPEDIELHKSIDWAARNYEEYPVEDDVIKSDAYLYGNGNKVIKDVEFVKKLRANPIYPPYYGTREFQPFEGYLNGMYDGRKHGRYGIHDRFETQEVYDMLSENMNESSEFSKIANYRDSDITAALQKLINSDKVEDKDLVNKLLDVMKENGYKPAEDECLDEDTCKTSDGKWTNKGSEGTHGKFRTKKEADAQRKAMFANKKPDSNWGK